MNGFRLKSIYVILYMGYATWKVYYNVFLDNSGFSGLQIGVINALLQAMVILVVPVWGVIADKKGIRPTLRIAVIVSAILVAFLGDVLDFWLLIVYVILLALFILPLGSLTDALAVEYSKVNPKYNFGNLRLWGSLGWGVASIIAGVVFKHLELKLIFPVSAGIFLLSIYFFSIPRKRKKIYRPNFQPINIRELSKNYSIIFFLFILVLYGAACSPINAYLNLYFTELNADVEIIGLAYGIQSFSELPFFILGAMLLRKLGAKKMILISMVFMTIRLSVYWMIPNITIALIGSTLQGITFSFFLVGAVDYIHKLLPEGRNATAQSLLWGLYFGVGNTVGNLGTGILKDSAGMVGVMKYFSVFVLSIFLFTLLYFIWLKDSRKKNIPREG